MAARIVIAGGGTVGLEVARRLERSDADIDVTVVEPRTTSVYLPLLPEVASGDVDPRHATVPIRRGLTSTRVVLGELTGLDREARRAQVARAGGRDDSIPYDHLVVALGSITRLLPIPGLAEHATGFQTVAEALLLRDRVLGRLHLAADTDDPAARARALTVVVVGAGYSGVEVIGELESLARDACAVIPGLDPDDLRFVLVEATPDVLPMVAPSLRRRAVEEFEGRSIEVRLETLVESVEGTLVHLSDGTTVDADTLVWCAGGRPHPALGDLDLPLDEQGQLRVEPTLQVEGVPEVWGAGDGAAVPDLVTGGMCPPSAQYAIRQARQLAANLVAVVEGRQAEPFRYEQRGELITLGRHRAVGEIFGLRLAGRLPWILRHLNHVARVPTRVAKARLVADWTVGMAFPREITELGSVTRPRRPIEEAAEAMEEDHAGG